MGLGATLMPTVLTSCKKDELLNVTFSGKVLIIGAGAAGLMAGYILNRYGIDFQILEASSTFGGRVKKTTTFADFPIDLGAEWLHDKPSTFARLIDDENAQGSVDLIPYNPSFVQRWNGSALQTFNVVGNVYGEYKFKHTTWHDFFADYIEPSISNKIVYNCPVIDIDYSGSGVVVTNNNIDSFTADKVLVTVPTAILKSNMINFNPALPADKISALNNAEMPDGIKVFMEFSQRFYPDILSMPAAGGNTEKIFYDAAFKKNSNRHILALFNVGDSASEYTSMVTEQDIINRILEELDEIFDGQATQYYVKHIIQNWSAEPYVQGSYTFFTDENNTVATLKKSLNSKVYFAGEALSTEAGATVHGAGLYAKEVIEGILTGG